ncbi:MAG: AraC family transcriptional regulator [Paludibacteraceae bacterium]|nr:AraC family transcriptional regulator [Paludibacteraceae bacterium]
MNINSKNKEIPVHTISAVASCKNMLPYYYISRFDTTRKIRLPHIHDYYAIFLFEEGRGINVIDFKEYPIKPRRLFFMYPGQIHNWSHHIDITGFVLVFHEFCLRKEQLDLRWFQHTPYVDIPMAEIRFFKDLFVHLIDEYEHLKDYSENHIAVSLDYLLSLLEYLFRQQYGLNAESVNSKLYQFRQLINNTITENISVEDYACRLKLSVYELNRICKKSVAVSAKQFILVQKLTEAKRLLLYSDLNVAEVAYHLGFEDNSYFTKFFKQKTGYTPTHFVETHRGK